MPLLTWKPEYTVNEEVLDNHHQKLFDILNTAYENVINSLEVVCVLPIIDALLQHMRYHFLEEELHMREKGFHEIDAHIAKHAEFTRKIETLKTNYHGNNLEVTQDLIKLLGKKLLSHVLTEDRKYSLEFE